MRVAPPRPVVPAPARRTRVSGLVLALGLALAGLALAGVGLSGLGLTDLAAVPEVRAQTREGASVSDIEAEAEADRERARALREKAAALAEEIRALKGTSVTLARRVQDLEGELSQLEDTFAALKARERAKLAALDRQRTQLTRTLAALQRIALRPPAALAFGGEAPVDTVRGALLLGEAVPKIEARATDLRAELADLRALRTEMAAQQARVVETRTSLDDRREEIAEVVARKRELRQELQGRSRAAAEQAARLADRAENLRELVTELSRVSESRRPETPQPLNKPADAADAAEAADAADTEAAPPAAETDGTAAEAAEQGASPQPSQVARLVRPENVRDFPETQDSLRLPVSGRVVTRYGEPLERAGVRSSAKGIVIATRPAAQVVAPYDGKVAYAGPFRGYGRILIIEHGTRYHSLLAGLDRINAIVGQWVLAGEPLGLMAAAPDGAPELYMELRRTGRPINPLPWVAQSGEKVKG